MKRTILATMRTGNKIPVPATIVSKELGVHQVFYTDINRKLVFLKDSFVVVHIHTGFRVCHTYFTQPEAVALAKELSTLPGWERVRSDSDPRHKGYGERNKAAVGKEFLDLLSQIVEKHAEASRRYINSL